jgi:tRNA nucleotidyltransferase (CCA-adding enzyme)
MVSERLAALREEAGTWLGLLGYPIEHLVWEVYLCLLLRELPSDTRSLTLQRLELTRQEREAIEQYARLGEGNPLTDLSDEVSPVTIVEALEPIALPVLMTFALTSDDWRGSLNMVRLFRSRLQNIKPELNGKDLISLGLPEGAPIGEALKRLREARLRGEVASRLDEVQFIQRTFRLS